MRKKIFLLRILPIIVAAIPIVASLLTHPAQAVPLVSGQGGAVLGAGWDSRVILLQ